MTICLSSHSTALSAEELCDAEDRSKIFLSTGLMDFALNHFKAKDR